MPRQIPLISAILIAAALNIFLLDNIVIDGITMYVVVILSFRYGEKYVH